MSIKLIKYILIFVGVMSYHSAKAVEFSPSYTSDLHYVENKKYCNIVNFVKICGDVSMLNNELSKNKYNNDYYTEVTLYELRKKLGTNSLSRSQYRFLDEKHEISKIWRDITKYQSTYISNNFFRDARVKSSFNRLLPVFSKYVNADVWAEITITPDSIENKKYTEIYRELCENIDKETNLDRCFYLTHRNYTTLETLLAMWMNSFLYFERIKLIESANVIVINTKSKTSPSIDRVGNLYLSDEHLEDYKSKTDILKNILAHEVAHAAYFYDDLIANGGTFFHSSYIVEANGAKVDMNAVIKMFMNTMSNRNQRVELLVDLQAIAELSPKQHRKYIESLEKYAPGEIGRISLAGMAVNLKENGDSVYDLLAYTNFRSLMQSFEFNAKHYPSYGRLMMKLDHIETELANDLNMYNQKYITTIMEAAAEDLYKISEKSIELVKYEDKEKAPSEEEIQEQKKQYLNVLKELRNTSQNKISSIFSKRASNNE